MKKAGQFFVLTIGLLLASCGGIGVVGRIGVGGVEDIAVQRVRLKALDALVRVEIANGNKKKITFESCRMELRHGGRTVAVVTLPGAVELEPQSRQVREIPVRVHLSGMADGVGLLQSLRTADGTLGIVFSLTLRREGDSKSRTVRLKKTIDKEDLAHIL